MAQFGGNKNPPWAQGGRGGQAGGPQGGPPGGPPVDVPGLVGAFGAGQPGPPVFHQGGPANAGLPPGLAGAAAAAAAVGHLGVPATHGPAVTLAAMASQPVRPKIRPLFVFQILIFFSWCVCSFQFRVFTPDRRDWARLQEDFRVDRL